MLILVPILLMLKIGRCTIDHIFTTKTVDVGQNVTLTSFAFDYNTVNQYNHRISAKQGPGAFVLHITKTQLSDTAVYYCIKVKKTSMTFLGGTFLRIKGPEPDITAVTQDFPSDPVRPGDSVTLQCSVLSDSESKSCPEEHKVYWFRAGSDESHLSLIYAHENRSDQCEKSPEIRSPQKCVYSFSKKVSSSDAGTYYCAVATCGEILFGNGTKLDIEENLVIDVTLLLLCKYILKQPEVVSKVSREMRTRWFILQQPLRRQLVNQGEGM
ncbi:signal-regulatory protein beta-2-like [Scomber scombrus]|uniref:Signal-regulatory protein beta-2-like n=1 Tax=Scomber scombrus TaxID=13677 RepID=A0AAV1P2Y8_SCOSC